MNKAELKIWEKHKKLSKEKIYQDPFLGKLNNSGLLVINMDQRNLISSKTDGHCTYYGVKFDKDNKGTPDHVIPQSKGGSNRLSNFLPACRSCNSAKHTRSLEEFRMMPIQSTLRKLKNIPHKLLPSREKRIIQEKLDEIIKRLSTTKITFYFETLRENPLEVIKGGEND